MIIREYTIDDIADMIAIWNEVIEEGNAFPHEEMLDEESATQVMQLFQRREAFASGESWLWIA